LINAKGYKSLLVLLLRNRDWIFHPSIRLYENPNLKASVYRYPSPGNARDNNLTESYYEDYKTPYEHSRYNVRYANPTPAQTSDKITEVKVDSPGLTPLLKYLLP
jgi:hypothetical protein